MSEEQDQNKIFLVDASVFITLVGVDATDALIGLNGYVAMPRAVVNEVSDDPAASALADLRDQNDIQDLPGGALPARRAARHLGRSFEGEDDGEAMLAAVTDGDVGLLTYALAFDDREEKNPVVVTDDKPLRDTCRALSIAVSGSIGVLVRAVERDDVDPEVAKRNLYAMDEVGARLSASLVKKAERLIDDAASES